MATALYRLWIGLVCGVLALGVGAANAGVMLDYAGLNNGTPNGVVLYSGMQSKAQDFCGPSDMAALDAGCGGVGVSSIYDVGLTPYNPFSAHWAPDKFQVNMGGDPIVALFSNDRTNFDLRGNPTDPSLNLSYRDALGIGSVSGLEALPTDVKNSATSHLVIIQRNDYLCADGQCDIPDNDPSGGTVVFDFSSFGDVSLSTVDLVDIAGGRRQEVLGIVSYSSAGEALGFGVLGGRDIGRAKAGRLDLQMFLTPTQVGRSAWERVAYLQFTMVNAGAFANLSFDPTVAGSSSPPDPQTNVPTPSAILLVGAGLVSAGVLRRRRRRYA